MTESRGEKVSSFRMGAVDPASSPYAVFRSLA